ncbi:MAG: hypothetical protein RIB32_01590 [Phycisphaerales bacterium]
MTLRTQLDRLEARLRAAGAEDACTACGYPVRAASRLSFMTHELGGVCEGCGRRLTKTGRPLQDRGVKLINIEDAMFEPPPGWDLHRPK